MIWHRQGDFLHGKQGMHKTFGLAIGQMEHFFYRQHDLNRLVTVVKLTAALFFACVQPVLFKSIRQPERNRAALCQRFVIVRPIFDTV